jgi:hypothetical protein
MTVEMHEYERMRASLYGGFDQNLFARLLKDDRAAIGGPLQGTPHEFCQILYQLTKGELNKPNDSVAYEVVGKGGRDILKFSDGSLFKVVRAMGGLTGSLIVLTPFAPSMDDLLDSCSAPLERLVAGRLRIQDVYTAVANDYRREERRLEAEKASRERKVTRESTLEAVLTAIESAGSGQTVMVRGRQNIDALVKLGFVPGLVDNPDNWVDAEDFPGMRYCHERSGIEILLTAREKLQPIEELNRLEFFFLVNRSDGDPAAFRRMAAKFRETRQDGTAYSMKEFHDALLVLVKYPEELKGRTEEDLGLVANEVELVIDRRRELDKGILPYEAVFARDTRAIIDHIVKNRTSVVEIRKALDYFEYTGMIDAGYKAALHFEIRAAIAPKTAAAASFGDLLNDRRVKEIVAEVLRKIPRERLTTSSITLALTPYVRELGLGKLVMIRDRMLQLKEIVHHHKERGPLPPSGG